MGDISWMTQVQELIIKGNRDTIPPWCPASYQELIQSCWAQDPASRPNWETVISKIESDILPIQAPFLDTHPPTQEYHNNLKSIWQAKKEEEERKKEMERMKQIDEDEEREDETLLTERTISMREHLSNNDVYIAFKKYLESNVTANSAQQTSTESDEKKNATRKEVQYLQAWKIISEFGKSAPKNSLDTAQAAGAIAKLFGSGTFVMLGENSEEHKQILDRLNVKISALGGSDGGNSSNISSDGGDESDFDSDDEGNDHLKIFKEILTIIETGLSEFYRNFVSTPQAASFLSTAAFTGTLLSSVPVTSSSKLSNSSPRLPTKSNSAKPKSMQLNPPTTSSTSSSVNSIPTTTPASSVDPEKQKFKLKRKSLKKLNPIKKDKDKEKDKKRYTEENDKDKSKT